MTPPGGVVIPWTPPRRFDAAAALAGNRISPPFGGKNPICVSTLVYNRISRSRKVTSFWGRIPSKLVILSYNQKVKNMEMSLSRGSIPSSVTTSAHHEAQGIPNCAFHIEHEATRSPICPEYLIASSNPANNHVVVAKTPDGRDQWSRRPNRSKLKLYT